MSCKGENMQEAITITPEGLVTIFLGICGAIAIVGEAIKWVATALKKIHKPEEQQNEAIKKLDVRVTNVEARVTTFDRYFKNDQEKLNELLEGIRVLQRVNLVSLSHAIHGSGPDELKEAERELQEYLTRKEN